MQSNLDRSLSAVLKLEGGYVNNPKDNGGPTNLGVTLANFRRFVKPGGTIADLKALTKEQAEIVFQRQFWDAVVGSQLPSGVDYATFDMSVHSGPKLAGKFLQRALGAAYTGMVDGVVGPKTLKAAGAVPAADVINRMLDARMAFLKGHEDWLTFGKGWTNRVNAVRRLALEMASAQPAAVPDEPTPPEPETPATDAPRDFQISWPKVIGWALLLAGALFIVDKLFA